MNVNVLSTIDQWLERLFEPGEKRDHPSQITDAWLKSIGRYARTASGTDIDEGNALEIMPGLACVKVLAESVAQLPLVLYRNIDERKRERARNHPLFDLLHNAPNPEMTSFYWRETMMGHLALRGNAYSEIEYDGAGRVIGLWPLRPDRTKPIRNNGNLLYEVNLPDGSRVLLPRNRVLHIPGFGYDGIVGYSPVALAREAIGLAKATEQFGAAWFGNGSRPGGVYKHPGHLSDKAFERLKDSLEEKHKGLENAHRVAILEEGLDWQQIGIAPEDSQFLQTRKFQVSDIARMFRVPAHMAGDLERATFSNIEQQSLEFVIYTLMPWLTRWEQQMLKDLLTQRERAEFYIRFVVDGLLRGDNQSRWEAYTRSLQQGVYSINDVRLLEDLNPIEGGDVHLVPLNMIPLEQVMTPAAGMNGTRNSFDREKRENGETRETEVRAARVSRIGRGRLRLAQSYELVMREAAGRAVRREVADVGRAVKKYLGQRDATGFVEWLREFYQNHFEFWVRAMLPIMLSYADLIGMNVAEELGTDELKADAINDFIEKYVQALAAREKSSSQTQLRALLDDAVLAGDDPAIALETRLGEWDERRPAKVANENSRTGICAMALAFYGTTRLVTRWVVVNVGDSCPYCQALDGRVVGIDEVIIRAGEEFRPDGVDTPLTSRHDIRHPQFHDGCDCQVAAEMG